MCGAVGEVTGVRSGSRRGMWAKSGWREVNEESSVMMLKFRQGYWLDPGVRRFTKSWLQSRECSWKTGNLG